MERWEQLEKLGDSLMSKVLIVDDKEMMRDSVATILGRRGHTVIAAASGAAALERIASKKPDLVVTDLQMPGMSGLELLEEIRAVDEDIPVIFMTAYGSIETAVDAMRKGAFDYVTKPFSGDELTLAVDRGLECGHLRKENSVLKATVETPVAPGVDRGTRMVGNGAAMTAMKSSLVKIAESHGTVLINGESGTGKEVAARFIHESSPRRNQPFLALNCAALSPALLESELFGHEKGAFTGADKLRKGRFELADGGTLLLDEISEIPADLQAKLLRVLQEQCFDRVGSSTTHAVDVRVIATSNRDLSAEVDAGRFKGDLFFRLNVLPIEMPSLRNRVEDLPALADHFFSELAVREGGEGLSFDSEAMDSLMAYHWPGNVRELQNICERAAVLSTGPVIKASLVAPWLSAHSGAISGVSVFGGTPANGMGASEVTSSGTDGDPSLPSELPEWMICNGRLKLADIERETILATLARNGGHRQKSAKALGIGVRTLGLKLKKWKDEQLVEAGV